MCTCVGELLLCIAFLKVPIESVNFSIRLEKFKRDKCIRIYSFNRKKFEEFLAKKNVYMYDSNDQISTQYYVTS